MLIYIKTTHRHTQNDSDRRAGNLLQGLQSPTKDVADPAKLYLQSSYLTGLRTKKSVSHSYSKHGSFCLFTAPNNTQVMYTEKLAAFNETCLSTHFIKSQSFA